jgi:hypothetical protein
MKLLLTSAGIKNPSIHDALVDLLGNPISEVQRPLHSHRDVRAPLSRSRREGMGVHSADENPAAPCASWGGSRWECWS